MKKRILKSAISVAVSAAIIFTCSYQTKGYNMELNEETNNISEGQKQINI